MNSLNTAVANVIGKIGSALENVERPITSTPTLPTHLQAAWNVLDRPPSPLLASAMQEVFAFTARSTGEVVKVRQESFRATKETVCEARQRLAAISIFLTTRPEPGALVDW